MRVLPLNWQDDGTTLSTRSYAMAGREVDIASRDIPVNSPMPSFVATTHRMRQWCIGLAWAGFGWAGLSAILIVALAGPGFAAACTSPELDGCPDIDGAADAVASGFFIAGMVVAPLLITAAAAIFGLLLGRFTQIADTHVSPRLEGGDPTGTLATRTDRVGNTRRLLLRRDRRALGAIVIGGLSAVASWLLDRYADAYYVGHACADRVSDDCLNWTERGGAFAVIFGSLAAALLVFAVYSAIARLPLRRRLRRYMREAEADALATSSTPAHGVESDSSTTARFHEPGE